MANGKYELIKLRFEGGYGDDVSPRAWVTLSCPDDHLDTRVGCSGVGTIDCCIQAVNFIIGENIPRLASFNAWMKASEANMGSAAPGNCGLTLYARGEARGERVLGHAQDPDIVVASVRAYIDGVNRLLVCQKSRQLELAEV